MFNDIAEHKLRLLRSEWAELVKVFQQLRNRYPAYSNDLRYVDKWIEVCQGEMDYLEKYKMPVPIRGDFDRMTRELINVVNYSDQIRENSVLTRDKFDKKNEGIPGFWQINRQKPRPGEWFEITNCRNKLERLRWYIMFVKDEIDDLIKSDGHILIPGGIKDSIDDLSKYPILTSSADLMGPALPSSQVVPGAAPLQRIVDHALRNVLGRKPRIQDPRSFVAALNNSFQAVEVEGQTRIEWARRGSAGLTDLGTSISGAQASLYTRAKVIRDNVLPLLDGLEPLLSNADEELVEATRAIVRNQLSELVNELGVEGGPRQARVDLLFRSLLKEQIKIGGPGQPQKKGYLNYLQHVFGFDSSEVVMLEEEVMYTNFTMIRDYVKSLNSSWKRFKRYRNKPEGRDLGTSLGQLEGALLVVAEAVDEVTAAMDSVFVGEAERQWTSFKDGQGKQEMRVADLLNWISTFTTEEAKTLIDDGGRRGVEAITPTLRKLHYWVNRFIQVLQGENGNIPDGMRHPRVERSLRELHGYLIQALELSQAV